MRTPSHRLTLTVVLTLCLASCLSAGVFDEPARDPALSIPWCNRPPTIDGELGVEEWQFAAALALLEEQGSGGHGTPGVLRQEQPVFYVFRDRDNLYVAMDAIDSNTSGIIASCVQHDHKSIIGNDCVEMMIAPGAGEMVQQHDFPVYYFALNALGTVWDAKFFPRYAETHNSWQSGVETVSKVDGTHWTCEMRIPFGSIRKESPADDETWRMNFDRTYSGYNWQAWDSRGSLNKAESGGDVTFRKSAAVRFSAVHALVDGRLELRFEVANPTDQPQTVTLELTGEGQDDKTATEADTQFQAKGSVTVPPGEVKDLVLGRKELLKRYNRLVLSATDDQDRLLLYMQRRAWIPTQRFVTKPAPRVPLVHVFPRFLPSLERLAVSMDYTAWVRKTGFSGAPPTATIRVWPEGQEDAKPAIAGTFSEFRDNRGTWRHDTQKLPEGRYAVNVTVTAGRDQVLVEHDDWFVKKIFDWMKNQRGVGDAVPTPYTPLAVKGSSVSPWGRRYTFAPTGLLREFVSQDRPLLSGEMTLLATVDGKDIKPQPAAAFAFAGKTPAVVTGKASSNAGDLKIDIESTTEYDGLTRFRMTYGPAKGPVKVDRIRLRVPLDAQYCRFYSASGDHLGTSILGAVLPDTQGKVFDSKENTYAVSVSPTFCTLYWVGDYETCFCYASDICEGWVLRDDAPAVEVFREGKELILWLNLVDRPVTLAKPRTLEFAFQAGPLKPLPDKWRGIQRSGNPDDALVTIRQIGGSGNTMHGSANFMHPGVTPEQIERSKARIESMSDGDRYSVIGYHRWPLVVKGFPETAVFRGEWGIDKATWDRARGAADWAWKSKFYGPDKAFYQILFSKPMQSYVDFCTYAYDETLKHTKIYGFYDDTGYPKSVYDEEFGHGYIREDGRKISSSGLWVYRERWKRAAYVNFQHQRANYLGDSQHVSAHFLPAYGFIGVWAPCERGYYNPFPERDNLEFYGSIERYYAFNPSHAFGQISTIGMSTPEWEFGEMARDTRCMMMLTMLHDQGLECWGNREQRTMCRLRQARSVFKQWEDDVSFTGYWRNGDVIKKAHADARISLYQRPGSALFMIGNVGDQDIAADVAPDWKALQIDPGKLALANPETGAALKLEGGQFTIPVPRHDVRLVLAGDLSRYRYQPQVPGKDLPPPANVVAKLSDPLSGPDLDPGWESGLAQGKASVGSVDGRVYVQGASYGYAYIRRRLEVDNVSAQCMVLGRGGLYLYWPNNHYVGIQPYRTGEFECWADSRRLKLGRQMNAEPVDRWFPYAANWLKVRLTPETIEFIVSADGETWETQHTLERGPDFAGAPQYAILGYTQPGKEPLLQNVHPQHFRPEHPQRTVFFSDFVVGKN